MSKPTFANRLPLLLVMAGGLLFALGMRWLGIIATGVGAMLYALGIHKVSGGTE